MVRGAHTLLRDLHECIYSLLEGIQQQQQPRTVEVVLKRDPQVWAGFCLPAAGLLQPIGCCHCAAATLLRLFLAARLCMRLLVLKPSRRAYLGFTL